MRIDAECNNVCIFARDKDKTGAKYTDKQTDRKSEQTRQANRQSLLPAKEPERDGGEGGMLTTSRREGNIHQLLLVVLVAKDGN